MMPGTTREDRGRAEQQGATARAVAAPPTEAETVAIRIRIDADPLSVTDFSTFLSALSDLHARCWLLQNGRFADVADYAAGRHPRILREANLTIRRMSMNSPLNFDINLNPKTLAESITVGIDSMSQAGARKRAAEIEVEKRELEVADEAAKRVQELEIARRDADLRQAAERQRLQIETDQAELARREREVGLAEKLLALDTRRIEAETARLRAQQELMKAQLELADQATATAERLVGILRGGSVGPEALPFLTKLLEPPLLQIGLIAGTADISVTVIEEAAPLDEPGPPSGRQAG